MKGIVFLYNMTEPWVHKVVDKWALDEDFESFDQFIRWAFDWKKGNFMGLSGNNIMLKKYQKRKCNINPDTIMKKHNCFSIEECIFFTVFVFYSMGIRLYILKNIEHFIKHFFLIDTPSVFGYYTVKFLKYKPNVICKVDALTIAFYNIRNLDKRQLRQITPEILNYANEHGFVLPVEFRNIKLQANYFFRDFEIITE